MSEEDALDRPGEPPEIRISFQKREDDTTSRAGKVKLNRLPDGQYQLEWLKDNDDPLIHWSVTLSQGEWPGNITVYSASGNFDPAVLHDSAVDIIDIIAEQASEDFKEGFKRWLTQIRDGK